MPYISSIERIGRQEGLQEGVKNYIQSLLKNRFGIVDEELSSIIEPLAQMPDDDVAGQREILEVELLETWGKGRDAGCSNPI